MNQLVSKFAIILFITTASYGFADTTLDFEKPEDSQEWEFKGSDGPNYIVEERGVNGSRALAWSATTGGPFATAKLLNPIFGNNVEISFKYARPLDNFSIVLENGENSASLIHADGLWYGDLASNNDAVWHTDGTYNEIRIRIRNGRVDITVNDTKVSLNKDMTTILKESGNHLSFSIWGGKATEGYLDDLGISE